MHRYLHFKIYSLGKCPDDTESSFVRGINPRSIQNTAMHNNFERHISVTWGGGKERYSPDSRSLHPISIIISTWLDIMIQERRTKITD